MSSGFLGNDNVLVPRLCLVTDQDNRVAATLRWFAEYSGRLLILDYSDSREPPWPMKLICQKIAGPSESCGLTLKIE